VGTQKGGFVPTSEGRRSDWTVHGPLFGGWEVYNMTGSPADPSRLYASQSTVWFGQLVQRSDDGGESWRPVGNDFVYDGEAGTHQWYDGTPHPWEFARVWHLEPSFDDPHTVFGAEDASLFKSTDGGLTWSELAGLRTHSSGPEWQPGAGGMCVHTVLVDPTDSKRMHVAISAAGVFRSDDGGETWRPANRGLRSEGVLDPDAEVGHCVHRIARHPSRPDVLFMQKHWDVMLSDDGGDTWREVSGNLGAGIYGARFDGATETERRYLFAMSDLMNAEGDPVRSGDFARALERDLSAVSPTRDALIRKGVVHAPEHGLLAFSIPGFQQYIARRRPDEA